MIKPLGMGMVQRLSMTLIMLCALAAPQIGGATDGGLQFDGVNDRVTFGVATGLNSATFTIEAWFKRTGAGVITSTGTGGVTNAIPLVTKGRGEADGSNKDMNYFLGIRASDNVLVADFEEGSAGASPGLNHPVAGVTPIMNDVWYHAAATYDGTTLRLFLNGALESDLVVGQPPRSDCIQHAGLATAFTSTGAAAGYFQGLMDEVRIWNYALTAEQLMANKCLEITSASGLLGRWGLNQTSGTTATNSAGAVNGTLANGPIWVAGFPFPNVPNYSPLVCMLNPTNNSTFAATANFTITAAATDANGCIAKVEFFQGDTKLGEDTTSPFTCQWNNVPAGQYAITAVATDNNGMAAMAEAVTVSVNLPGSILFGYDNLWKFNQTDPFGTTSWRDTDFDDSAWPSGQSLLYVTTATTLPEPKRTPLTLNNRSTFYFRTHFNFAGAGSGVTLQLSALIDDGAVFYLNGVELHRIGMPLGPPAYATLANRTIGNANYEVWSLTPANLNQGDNVLAVEVHRMSTSAATDPDVVFGCELKVPSGNISRGPYLQLSTHNSAYVRWRTTTASFGRVRYGTDSGNLNLVAPDDTAATSEHVVNVTGLSPNTKYYYAVGTTASTPTVGDLQQFFVTHPTPGTSKPTRVWVLGDSGLFTANQRQVRDAYYNYAGATPTDLWLMLGDNAYNVGNQAEFQRAVFDMYPSMLRKSVLWPTRGNHETALDTDGQIVYYNIHTLPKFGEAGGVDSGEEAYYSFDYGDIHFVCLDSQGSNLSGTGTMATWLKNDLEATTARWIIAFWHHPPYSKGSHDSDSPTDSGGRMRDMRQNIVPIMDSHNVDLVLTGHSHSYERSYLVRGHYDVSSTLTPAMILNAGSGAESEPYTKSTVEPQANQGAVYVVGGSSGEVDAVPGPLNHPVMYKSLPRLGSVVLDINGDRLDAKFLRENGTIDDAFTMLKVTPTVVTVTASDDVVTEEMGFAGGCCRGEWTVTRTGDTTQELSVNCSVDGTATPGQDYYPNIPTSTIYFAPNVSSVAITIDAFFGNGYEPNETLTLTLGSGPNYTVGGSSSATIWFYSVANLIPLAGDSLATAYSVSPNGTVVGISSNATTALVKASMWSVLDNVHWTSVASSALAVPALTDTVPFGVGTSKAVGWGKSQGNFAGFVTDGTTATQLPDLGWSNSKAFAISSNDLFAVGMAKANATDWHACVWDLSFLDVLDLGTHYDDIGYPNSVANDISETEMITYVGEAWGSSGSKPLVWNYGFIDELFLSGTDDNGSAQGMNNYGNIVGYAWTGPAGVPHAVRWDSISAAATTLPLPPDMPEGTATYALKINNPFFGSFDEVIVGYASHPSHSTFPFGIRAVVWLGGNAHLLDTLAPVPNGSYTIAYGVNDTGEVVGQIINNGVARAFSVRP